MWEVAWQFHRNLFVLQCLLILWPFCPSLVTALLTSPHHYVLFPHYFLSYLLSCVFLFFIKCVLCMRLYILNFRPAVERCDVLCHAALSSPYPSLRGTCVQQHGDTFIAQSPAPWCPHTYLSATECNPNFQTCSADICGWLKVDYLSQLGLVMVTLHSSKYLLRSGNMAVSLQQSPAWQNRTRVAPQCQ